MEAYGDKDFARIVNNVDITAPDGMSLLWSLRKLGHKNAERIKGKDLTLEFFKRDRYNS